MTSPWWWRAAWRDGWLFTERDSVPNGSLHRDLPIVVNSAYEVSARRCGVFGGCLISTRPERPIRRRSGGFLQSRLSGAARALHFSSVRPPSHYFFAIFRIFPKLSFHLILSPSLAPARR